MERFIAAPEIATPMGLKGRELSERRFDVRLVNRKILDTLELA